MSFIATLLAVAADKFIDALAEHVAGDLYDKIKGEPSRKAYKRALARAIDRYAAGDRLILAAPLLDKKSILADEEVADELAQIMRFQGAPDLEVIGSKWKAALPDVPAIYNFTEEGQRFVGFLTDELRETDVFRPAFEAKALERSAFSAEVAADSLENIEEQLADLNELLTSQLGTLLTEFSQASENIHAEIRSFSSYINDKTKGFVGRKWVFQAAAEFTDANPRGYYFITGDPGVGKSALAAQMVKQNGYAHHFNIRAEGINKPGTFLKNVCAQLIAAYELDHTALPTTAGEDAGFLNKLLLEVSGRLVDNERCIIVVDALDEVDRSGVPAGTNLLYLPKTLPQGTYVIVTMRPDYGIKPYVECEQGVLQIEHDSSSNLADITDYIQAATARGGIREYIHAQRITTSEFVDVLTAKSEGNFMYLRHVLPEIERGFYQDLGLGNVPSGLQSYYEDHWRRMRGADEDAWFTYKLPVLVALSVVREPASINLISRFSQVRDRRRVREVIREWSSYIHEEEVDYNGESQRWFRLYHSSFIDFIASKQEIADERVDLIAMNQQIADALLGKLLRDD